MNSVRAITLCDASHSTACGVFAVPVAAAIASAPNAGGLRHWTRAEEQTLIALRDSGVSRAEIACSLQRSFKAVKTRLAMVRSIGLMR